MDDKIETTEPAAGAIEPSEVDSAILQEVHEIREAVNEVVRETALSDKVEELRTNLENISDEVQSWRSWHKDTYVEVLETLKSQVEEIETEWDNVSGTMKAQRERLETLLQTFPGAIETSTLQALSLRITHLEKLVSELVGESISKSTAARARKQLIISLVALGVTIILWSVWLVMAFTR